MSILNQNSYNIYNESLVEEIREDWSEGALAYTIINNAQHKLFKEKLSNDNGWEWFRLIMMIDVPHQMEWLETVLLKGIPIDKPWKMMSSGHQVTIFDLIDQVQGGIRKETRDVIEKIRCIYEILFLRKDVQPALDILNDLEESEDWMALNFVLSCYITGPTSQVRPMLHYIVSMERYDLVRGMLHAATELHTKFNSDTFLPGWINMKDDEGGTVLHITAKQQKMSWVKWFVSNYANPLIKDVYDKTAFNYAPKIEYLQLFWEKCEDKPTAILNNLLIQGVENVETLEWILKNGANPNTEGAFKTASKNPGQIKKLVEYGGDPTAISPNDNWNKDIILEWLCNGGSGGLNYVKMCIDNLTGKKSAEWICFLISLYNKNTEIASFWWSQCNDENKLNYISMIDNIVPKTTYMVQYKKLLENSKNI